MKTQLASVFLALVIAVLAWSCARTQTHADDSTAPQRAAGHEARHEQAYQRTPTGNAEPAAPAQPLVEPAAPAVEGLWSSEAEVVAPMTMPSAPPAMLGAGGSFRVLATADTAPNDRDLGRGAGTEPLGGRPGPQEPTNSERYTDIRDNPFVRVAEAGGDASTFAIDVDTASYSNVRRYILNDGQLPPAAAVRIEEMLNYFPYPYPIPAADAKHPFAFATAVAACPWQPQHRLVRVALKGKVLDQSTRPPLNLVYLIDTSGSMHGPDRIGLIKTALDLLVGQLDARDRLTIVTYAGNVGTALPPTPGDQHQRIRDVIQGLGAGGSTNGEGGIRAAYAAAVAGHRDGVQSRVILCTDGDFNVGVSDPAELRRLIEQQRETGVFLSAYGFGRGNYQDATMETLTNHGNGVAGYIADEREARKIMVEEALGSLVTIAKDVKIQVFFNPTEVAGWRLIGYENRLLRREDFNNDRIDAGDIGAGHTVTALYEIVPVGLDVPTAPIGDPNPFTSEYANEELGIANGTLLRLRLRAKQPDGDTSVLQEVDVATTVTAMDDDFRFASGVALTGMLLRGSPYVGTGDWSLASTLASGALGADPQGLRAEFIGLIGRAKGMTR